MDGYDEANSRFSQVCKRDYNGHVPREYEAGKVSEKEN
jgi:hypothetical protein